MDILTLDFETFYNSDYSLRKMSPVEYILDPRFECTGLAIKRGEQPAEWIEGDKVQEFFDNEPEEVICVSHNSLFDMSICAWRYGWVPRLMVDTLGVSRSTLQAYLRSLSLDNVAKYLGLGTKTGALANVRNMTLEQIRAHPKLHREHIEYGKNDADLCYGIFKELVINRKFPVIELAVMDGVIRCAVEPKFLVNNELLQESLNDIRQAKENMLAQATMLGADGKSDLMSNEKFANLLRGQGVTPPTKISGTTGKVAYAFAKSDQAFIDLLEHPNVAVATLVAARMGHKSTIEESRHERFINIGNLEWPKTKRSPGGYTRLMPMPLRYGGAHTHRLCLVGSTEITILRNKRVVCVNLQELEDDDLVWDGSEFVSHGGLSFAGVKKVITYDEITGTPDHRVWTVQHGYRSLEEAKTRGYDIARGATPDAARVEAPVCRANKVFDAGKIHLRKVRGGDGIEVVGHTTPGENLVPVLPQKGGYEGQATVEGNAAASLRTITEPEQYAPVWDIIDCGPRNRFMANGRIVHNSGDWKMNVQNMGRGSKLRQSLEAPEGYTVVAGDESQVEARFVATLAGQEDLRMSFQNGEDVYCHFAGDLFGRTISKADKVERWLGKTCILGLGFGLGKDKFGEGIPVLSFNQLGTEMPMPPEEAARVVSAYRNRYPMIAASWKVLGNAGIRALSTGDAWRWGPVVFQKEEIVLPNGMSLYYHNLKQVTGGRFGTEWVFEYGGKVKRAYGGMLLENVVQALARIVVMEAMLRIRKRLEKLNIEMALQVHDELVFIVRHEHVEVTRKVMEVELRRRPVWLPNLPLDCEVGVGPNYGEAK